ncbi:uncharacterized protein G2W53_003739 [Senna tora]|uniref:Uncharacterized protein n=1 Tax=Senna tora TaxID=362788 RepID=A0A835CHA2_9FABA|nr:uncharacterized protein G2W53_003739 [Senna tora]
MTTREVQTDDGGELDSDEIRKRRGTKSQK